MITACVIAASILAAGPTPLQLLHAVRATYLKAGDIEAKFTQTYIGGLRGKKKQEHGRLWAKQDGRVRWQYEKPEPKFFIYDGTTAYYYEPLNSQVWVYDNFKDSKLATALRFLIGQGDLAEQFNAAPCKTHCGLGHAGEVVLELTPKEVLANIEQVVVVINKKTYQVRSSAMFDSLGYRTQFEFSDVKFHAKVADQKFVFETPAGVHVLKAAGAMNGRL